MVLGKLESNMKKNETGPCSYTIHKVNSKWMKDPNVRQEIIKILEENTENNICGSEFFIDMSPRQGEQKQK